MARSQKTIRLDPTSDDQAHITILSKPNEIRLGVDGKSFIAIKEDGIAMSGSTPSKVSIQGLSTSMKYAGGLIQDLPFPLALMPTTMATPFPKQIFIPPLNDMLKVIRLVSTLTSLLPV